jgi:hypothetical protein
MRGCREGWSPSQSANRDNSLSVLRYAEIGCIDLPKVNPVTNANQRLNQIQNAPPSFRREKAFDILEHEGRWSMFGDDLSKA